MELSEAITIMHEAVEGRYDLTGNDMQEIHDLLCTFQESTVVKEKPTWLTDEEAYRIKKIWDSHVLPDDGKRVDAIKNLQRLALRNSVKIGLSEAIRIFECYIRYKS